MLGLISFIIENKRFFAKKKLLNLFKSKDKIGILSLVKLSFLEFLGSFEIVTIKTLYLVLSINFNKLYSTLVVPDNSKVGTKKIIFFKLNILKIKEIRQLYYIICTIFLPLLSYKYNIDEILN